MASIAEYRFLARIASDDEGRAIVRHRRGRTSCKSIVNHTTGTTLTVGKAHELLVDDSNGAWVCICETHGAILNTSLKRLAVSAAAYPDFCEDCVGILAAKNAS